MKTGVIRPGTLLFISGLCFFAVRIFFSMAIPDLGIVNRDVVCRFIPDVRIIFVVVLFICGMKK